MAYQLTRRERFEAAMARGLLALPAPVLAKLAGDPIARDGYVLDPQVQLAIRVNRLAGREKQPPSITQARAQLEASAAAIPPTGPAIARAEDGECGGVPVRVYTPRDARSPSAALMFFHGGGWCVGSLDSHDAPCRVIAAEANVIVVSVDYRLAPEHKFPAAVDDAVSAFRGLAASAARRGIDPSAIAVGGDSAGGNLAAVVAQQTKDDAVRPAFQWLIYPGTDMTMSHRSIESLGKGFFLEKQMMDRYIAWYLGGADRKDPRASPLFAPDLSGLPRAFVATAGFDPLRDEGEHYAQALTAAGVPCTYRCYGSMFHGFLNAGGAIRGARAALSDLALELARGLDS